jgi:uncharacterized membrane protein
MSAAPSGDRALPPSAYARMGRVLWTGLVISLVLLAGAIVAELVEQPRAIYEGAESNPSRGYLTIDGLAAGLAAGAPVAYLTLGVLCLVATPFVRVAAGFYYFRRGGERTMAAITLIVLVLLLFGLLVLGPLVR